MKVFIRKHRLLPIATFVLLAALIAVSLVSPLVQVQWRGSGTRALAAGSWTSQVTSGTSQDLNDIACPGPGVTTCFTVGASGGILNTTNGGSTTWTSQSSGTSNSLNGIACPGTGSIICFAVGAYLNGNGKNQVLNTTNGTSWSSQN